MEFGAAEILGMRASIAYVAIFVIFLSFSVVINRLINKKFTETFWFALGIGLHWIGTFQAQFGVIGILPEVFYYSGLFFVFFAGITKIRALTLGFNKTLWWVIMFSAIFFGAAIMIHAKTYPQEPIWYTPPCSSISLKN